MRERLLWSAVVGLLAMAALDAAPRRQDLIPSDVTSTSMAGYTAVATFEVSGNTTAEQFPAHPGAVFMVVSARSSNSGSFVVGTANTVTVPDGTSDSTSGLELAPGVTRIFPCNSNTNQYWHKEAAVTDDATVMVYK